MKRIIFTSWRWPILFILYKKCSVEKQDLIKEDIMESLKYDNYVNKRRFWICLVYELTIRKSTRNIFFYRTKEHKILSGIVKLFWPPMNNVEIGANKIGGGLTIPHGNVVLYAKTIGKNCHVCPGVVVGQIKEGKYPIIGDDCLLGANSAILGDIVIGKNVRIGAGAIVVQNVPDNSTAVGNPLRIIAKC